MFDDVIAVGEHLIASGVTPAGGLVPLSAVARFETTLAPLSVSHQGGSAAATISFALPEGRSIGEATEAINAALAGIGVPVGIRTSFEGSAGAFQKSMSTQPLLILAALVTIYIVLGMLYESLVHPITILSTLPSAGVGALLALMAVDFEFSLIAMIGVILMQKSEGGGLGVGGSPAGLLSARGAADWALAHLPDDDDLWAITWEGNGRSRAVMERLGLGHEALHWLDLQGLLHGASTPLHGQLRRNAYGRVPGEGAAAIALGGEGLHFIHPLAHARGHLLFAKAVSKKENGKNRTDDK